MEKNKNAGLLLVGVGTHLAAAVTAGFILGYGLDYLLETTPIFMMLFGMMGFVAGIMKAHKLLTRFY
ncbi:AtpZ/AtpI family protein [Pseudomonadota bacterium]